MININSTYIINNQECHYRGVDKNGYIYFIFSDGELLKCRLSNKVEDEIKVYIEPYDYIKKFKPITMWSNGHGEIINPKTYHNRIEFFVDDCKVVFTKCGRLTWLSKEENCWRYDDCSDVMLFISSLQKSWLFNVYEKIS